MDKYITGETIKVNREKRKLTQSQLGALIGVSDKTVSKWETGRGYPDITILESLASSLQISMFELLSGVEITNRNTSGNFLKMKLYYCPVCGNVIFSMGEAAVSCCGINLPPLEAEEPDDEHMPSIEIIEDEYFISLKHDMTKSHYISFMGATTDQGFELIKLYPEGNAEARLKRSRTRYLYFYCNNHGLYKINIKKLMKACK